MDMSDSMAEFSQATKFVGVHMAATPAVLFVRKVTSDGQLAGRTVRASKDDPQYLVRRDKGKGEAVRKPSALKPVDK